MKFTDNTGNDVTLDTEEGIYFRQANDGRPEWSLVLVGTGPMNTPIPDILAAFSELVQRTDLEICSTSTLTLNMKGSPPISAARAIERHRDQGYFEIRIRTKR